MTPRNEIVGSLTLAWLTGSGLISLIEKNYIYVISGLFIEVHFIAVYLYYLVSKLNRDAKGKQDVGVKDE